MKLTKTSVPAATPFQLKRRTQLQATDQRYLLQQKSSPCVQTLLKCQVLCLVAPTSTPTLIQGAGLGILWGVNGERVERLVSIPNVSHSHISTNTAAASHTQGEHLHTHIRDVFGFSWAPGALCSPWSRMMDFTHTLDLPDPCAPPLTPQNTQSTATEKEITSHSAKMDLPGKRIPASCRGQSSINNFPSLPGPAGTMAHLSLSHPRSHSTASLSLMPKAALNSLPLHRGSWQGDFLCVSKQFLVAHQSLCSAAKLHFSPACPSLCLTSLRDFPAARASRFYFCPSICILAAFAVTFLTRWAPLLASVCCTQFLPGAEQRAGICVRLKKKKKRKQFLLQPQPSHPDSE